MLLMPSIFPQNNRERCPNAEMNSLPTIKNFNPLKNYAPRLGNVL